MQAALHDRHRCAQNVDHLAHNSPFSPDFAEVVCTLGTTPPQAAASPPPSGGNGVIRTATRRRHADSQLLMLQNPRCHRHGGRRRDRRAWMRCRQAAAPVGGRAWPDNEPKRRSKLAARTAEAGGADTAASQISHVIYRGHFSRCPKNVAIPTMQIQCLNESSRNYVRNWWLAAIAGYQGNASSNISREGPTGAEGAGGTAGPGRGTGEIGRLGCGARGLRCPWRQGLAGQ